MLLNAYERGASLIFLEQYLPQAKFEVCWTVKGNNSTMWNGSYWQDMGKQSPGLWIDLFVCVSNVWPGCIIKAIICGSRNMKGDYISLYRISHTNKWYLGNLINKYN